MAHRYRALAKRNHELVDDPERADFIVYFEPGRRNERDEILKPALRSDALIRQYPEKCFVADCQAGTT